MYVLVCTYAINYIMYSFLNVHHVAISSMKLLPTESPPSKISDTPLVRYQIHTLTVIVMSNSGTYYVAILIKDKVFLIAGYVLIT